jgi:ferritin-like metal-binding protein YciE
MLLATPRDLLIAQLRDLHSAEMQFEKAQVKLARTASNEALGEAFLHHLDESGGQLSRLARCFKMLGVTPRGPKCKGMEGLLAEGAATLEAEGEPAVIDAALIASAQRAEHYEIAAYRSAVALAARLGFTEMVELLDQSLQQEIFADETLTLIAEREVIPNAIAMGMAA